MNINKNSWHYRAYCKTYDKDWQIPSHTNLCQYVQRTFWFTLGRWSLKGLCWGILAPILTTLYLFVCSPVAFIFGGRPVNHFKSEGQDDMFKSYEPPKLWGISLYPWKFLLVGGIIFGEYYFWTHDLKDALWVHGGPAFIALLIGTIILANRLFHTETSKLFGAWFMAKKNRMCPLVEFSEAPTTTE